MLVLSILCVAAIIILIALSIIDFKTWILPDPLNLLLGMTGIAFHALASFQLLAPHELIFGSLLGAGFLYIIRMGGNAYYKQESLGLGDVKLLGAAGLWLGIEGVIIAIILGAMAGIVHGVFLAAYISAKEKTPFSLKRLMLPAGPGFCVGILLTGIWLIAPLFGFDTGIYLP